MTSVRVKPQYEAAAKQAASGNLTITMHKSGVSEVKGAIRATRPPRSKAAARAQIEAVVAANKHILDALAEH